MGSCCGCVGDAAVAVWGRSEAVWASQCWLPHWLSPGGPNAAAHVCKGAHACLGGHVCACARV